jgi:photosystem II stability/assembly factor-like uncharacterized protein
MARLALAALLVGGCTLVYGPPKGNRASSDLGAEDLSSGDGENPVVWSTQTAATLQNLRAITGCSATNLFAPGTGGTLDRSTAPPTWMVTLLGATDLLAASTSTCANLYVVGKAGTTYYSSDGVMFRQKTSGTGDLNGVWSNGVGAAAVGAGGVALFAQLGNNNWLNKPSGTTADLEAVWGSGATFYATGAAGTILRSTNSGQSWSAMTVGVATLRGGWASASGNDVYAVGDGGVILHSSDGGATWPASPSGTTATLRAAWGSAPDDVYAVGVAGTILHSTDSGASWRVEVGNTAADLNGVWGSSASDVYAVGDSGTILHRP